MGTASSMPIQKLDRWHWPLANKPHLKSKKGGRTRSAHSSAYYKRKLVLLLLRFPAASSSYSPTSTRLLQTATSLSIHPLVLLRLGILSRDTQQVCHKSLERQTRGAPMYGSPTTGVEQGPKLGDGSLFQVFHVGLREGSDFLCYHSHILGSALGRSWNQEL